MRNSNEQIIYYQGRYLKESEVHLSPFNRGFAYGEGVFETLRVYSGKVFRLRSHVERLFNGLKVLNIENSLDAAGLEKAVDRLIDENGLLDASLKIVAFREDGSALDPFPGTRSCYLILPGIFDHKRKKKFQQGISAGTVSIRRNLSSPHTFIKSLNYLENILGRRQALEKGFDEAVFLNNHEFVAEGSISNIFIVKDSVLITPPVEAGILNGITRGAVLETAAELGMKCREELFKTDEMLSADEAFMANSLMEVMPLIEVNGQVISKGRFGNITEEIINSYKLKVKKELDIK